MRCKICNNSMDRPRWNSDLKDWEVCSECLEVIHGVFEDYDDPASEEEEELIDAEVLIRQYEEGKIHD